MRWREGNLVFDFFLFFKRQVVIFVENRKMIFSKVFV